MDNLLLITILTIFATAFIGTMIRYRTRDKCLKGFTDYFVTLEMQDGKRSWGKLNVYHNGLELTYPSPHLDPDGDHFETSSILYQNTYKDIFALKRLHDELSPKNQKRREREVRITYHPNVFRRMGRRLRNLFNLLRDAFSQALTVFIGHVKKAGGSSFVASQDKKLQDTAKTIIGASAAAYEPILENYIGRKVVLEVMQNDQKKEFCGILKDYTDTFVTLLDVPIKQEHEFNLADPTQLEINRDLDFEIESEQGEDGRPVDLRIKLQNHGSRPVHICHAEGEGYSHVVDQKLEPGKDMEFTLPQIPLPSLSREEYVPPVEATVSSEETVAGERNVLPNVRLWVRGHRYMDMVVPRSLGIIRHGAESIGQTNVKFFLNLKTPE